MPPPNSFMPAAISTSEPIAIDAGTREIRMSAGVSSAPPPVDVAPTTTPTSRPIRLGP